MNNNTDKPVAWATQDTRDLEQAIIKCVSLEDFLTVKKTVLLLRGRA